MAYWLIKSEPSTYAYAQLAKDKRTAWTGIRNFAARNNLRAMAPDDQCLYYHTGEEKAVVGLARVVKAAYPDPTAKKGEDWACVDVAAVRPFERPVTLATLKSTPAFKGMLLLRRPRLSVVPIAEHEFRQIVLLGTGKA